MTEVSEGSRAQENPEKQKTGDFPSEEMDQQWQLVTEAIRRDLVDKPGTRKVLTAFCIKPITETLSGELINQLSMQDERVARLAERYKEGLISYLKVPPISLPDEIAEKGIRYAYDYVYKINRNQYETAAQRYRWARDIKLLALGAEISEQEEVVQNQEGEVILPSGVKINMDVGQDEQRLDLLQPHLWERRKQIMDRVYEIWINNHRYILKEKKTPAHENTTKGGHREGRLSSEEFAIAKDFQKKGTLEQGRVKLSWEKPIGFVTFPDGFQFSVFEFEEGLIGPEKIGGILVEDINAHRDQFEEEYNLISKMLSKYKNHPELSYSPPYNAGLSHLSFEMFARVKAQRIIDQAVDLMEDTITVNGYERDDIKPQHLFRILKNGSIKVEVVGLDFEYYTKIPIEKALQELAKTIQERKKRYSEEGMGFIGEWEKGVEITKTDVAAYFAMLDAEGVISGRFQNIKKLFKR